MASIFESSCITIAATKATGHAEGLHVEEDSRSMLERLTSTELGHGIPEDIVVLLSYPPRSEVPQWDSDGPVRQDGNDWHYLLELGSFRNDFSVVFFISRSPNWFGSLGAASFAIAGNTTMGKPTTWNFEHW
ncbi:Fc.00g104440.m01.CDS01 [Cosmosporella sp. VM-42]